MAPSDTGTATSSNIFIERAPGVNAPIAVVMRRESPPTGSALREQQTTQRSAKLKRREQRPAWRR